MNRGQDVRRGCVATGRHSRKSDGLPLASFCRPRGESGGAGRARTGDFRLAKAALSQLSYSPTGVRLRSRMSTGRHGRDAGDMVGLSGFEPLTSRLSAVRSSQLSYRPVAPLKAERLPCGEKDRLPKSQRAARRRPQGGSLKTR